MTAMHIYKKRNAAAALFLSFSVLLPTLLTGCSGQSSKTVSQDPVSRTDILFEYRCHPSPCTGTIRSSIWRTAFLSGKNRESPEPHHRHQ